MGAIGVAASLLLSAGVALAEEGSVNTSPRVEARKEVTEAKETAKARLEAVREEAKARLETTREEAKARLETTREEAKARLEATREEVKARLETVREDTQKRIKEEREKVNERVKDIQDKKQQQKIERLTAQLAKLNTTWTDHFMKLLERYDALVEKMQKRSDAAAVNGKDVTAANTAIQIARNGIATAQADVTAQASKTYTPDTSVIPTTLATSTPEGQKELTAALKTSFQQLHAALFKDLFALRDGPMKTVRGVVQDALRSLAQIPKVDEDNTSSAAPSGQ